MQLDAQVLDELVNRVLAVTQPKRIVLFGSGARGEMTPDSDLDLLIIVPSDSDCRQIAKAIYRNLIGYSLPVDVVVSTEADLNRYADTPGLIYRSALREGRELYAA